MKREWKIVIVGALAAVGLLCGSGARAARVPRMELSREIRAAGASVPVSGAGAAGRTAMLRPITLPEVFDAIRESLDSGAAGQRATLRPEDVLLQTQIMVGPGGAGLQVLRADLDAGLRRARFLLWSSKNPKVLPFIVTARLDQAPTVRAARAAPASDASRNVAEFLPAPVKRPQQEILVSAGQQATLVLHSDVLRMIAGVMPLERGVLGQRIRVRMLETGKIFNAQVDGRAHLDLKF